MSENNLPSIVELTGPDVEVVFSYFRRGFFFYELVLNEKTYIFGVELAGVGDATIGRVEKAALFRNYISKAMRAGTFRLCQKEIT